MAFTYFFRDHQTIEQALGSLIPFITGRSRIRVWDAGCASGQEPYTLALMMAERMGTSIFKNVEIHATDIDESNLFGKIIGDGIYSGQELQRIPPELLKKYFIPIPGDNYQINVNIRNKLIFKRENLLELKPTVMEVSMVICKNVLLHFSSEQRVEVIKLFHSALSDGGYFVTEQTQKMLAETAPLFEQVSGNAQVFRKISKN